MKLRYNIFFSLVSTFLVGSIFSCQVLASSCSMMSEASGEMASQPSFQHLHIGHPPMTGGMCLEALPSHLEQLSKISLHVLIEMSPVAGEQYSVPKGFLIFPSAATDPPRYQVLSTFRI